MIKTHNIIQHPGSDYFLILGGDGLVGLLVDGDVEPLIVGGLGPGNSTITA